MKLTEFLQRYQESTFEWIKGDEIHIHELPLGLEHLVRRLSGYLSDYVQVQGGGDVFVHQPFVLLETDSAEAITLARTPDVMLFAPGHITTDDHGIITTQPDLAVEIISRAEEIPEMYRKMQGYLKMGVHQVWLIDPDMQTLSIYQQHTKEIIVLGTRHKMQDNALLPDFEFDIVNLFA